jgi:hypothetical protein
LKIDRLAAFGNERIRFAISDLSAAFLVRSALAPGDCIHPTGFDAPPPPFTPHHAGRSGGRFRITLAGLPNVLAPVFRIYDAPAYFPALVTAPRWAGVGFCSSFRFARVREDRAARVPPVIRGSARLIRLPPPIGFRSFPPVPFILTSCVALSFPLAVRSLPPLAVAP